MTSGGHLLIVPTEGLLEVIHADHRIDVLHVLSQRGDTGEFVRLSHGLVTASWFSSTHGRLNPRARSVFFTITKVHLIFTGTVIFDQVEERLMGEIVGNLSLRETAKGGK